MSEHAIGNAKAWLENIQEMVGRLGSEDGEVSDAAREEITESVLCVEARTDWGVPGAERQEAEYRILLSTGGPALQITGDLSDGEPDYTPSLQWQDWGTPWTDYRMTADEESDLSAFVHCFYFGEG
jgi:hypothetical protein